jgi:hypothetical protein
MIVVDASRSRRSLPSGERARHAVRQGCSFAKKRESRVALLVVVQRWPQTPPYTWGGWPDKYDHTL